MRVVPIKPDMCDGQDCPSPAHVTIGNHHLCQNCAVQLAYELLDMFPNESVRQQKERVWSGLKPGDTYDKVRA